MNFSFESILAILIAITIHEFAHAWMANALGDPTARLQGRLTLNPFAHLDLIGTILLLLVGFGWGKPVPYDPRYLENPRLGSLLIALAGPVSNLILALIFAIPLKYMSADHVLSNFFFYLIFINLGLMVFNLIPIPPLDGSKILEYFIPNKYSRLWNNYLQKGPFILLAIILIERLTNIAIISPLIMGTIQKLALWIGLIT